MKDELIASTSTTVDNLIRGYDKFNNVRHQRTEANVHELRVSDKQKEQKLSEHDRRLGHIEKQLELQRSALSARHYCANRAWDEEPDSTRLRCNVHDGQLCSKEAIATMAHSWLDDLNIEINKHVHIHGGTACAQVPPPV